MLKLQHRWNSLDTKLKKGDKDIGDGILMCLQKIGLSAIEIRSFLKVGGSRLSRIIKFTTNCNAAPRLLRYHALSQISVDYFKNYIISLDVEDGFACAHRRPKFYVSKHGKAVTWINLHDDYTKK